MARRSDGDRRPVIRAPLGFGELVERQLLRDRVANARPIVSLPSARLRRGEIEPDFGLDPVLRHAISLVEKQTEQELRGRLALLGRLIEPAGGDRVVARNAQAVLIHVADIGLGDRRAALGFGEQQGAART